MTDLDAVLAGTQRWCVVTDDCVQVLRQLPDACIDAIVTDPPYGLEFMGQEWDRLALPRAGSLGGFADGNKPSLSRVKRHLSRMRQWHEAWASETLRVAKPGAHLLAFGGTRTFHQLAVGLEGGGWEIRDCLMWLYGQGMPKSLDVSKAIDAASGATRTVVGHRKLTGTARIKGGQGAATSGRAAELYATRAVRDDLPLTIPATKEAAAWSGWGTTLKPAYEPILLARKPCVGTVAENVLSLGVGVLNIDGCRVHHRGAVDRAESEGKNQHSRYATPGSNRDGYSGRVPPRSTYRAPSGRWPANVVLDQESARLLDEQSGTRPGSRCESPCVADVSTSSTCFGTMQSQRGPRGFADTGGASRFFYTAKATPRERWFWCSDCRIAVPDDRRREHAHGHVDEDGRQTWSHTGAHPTVKPLDLMRWLVRLVAPPGGVVLDPFAGSGTTVCAAIAEGLRCVGVEQREDYSCIARARVRATVVDMGTMPADEAESGEQVALFGGDEP